MKKNPLLDLYLSLGFLLFFCYCSTPTYSASFATGTTVLKPADYNEIIDATTRAVENTPGFTPEYIAANKKNDETLKQRVAGVIATNTPTEIIVTEKIPGMDCTEIMGGGPESKKYRCIIKSGFGSVMLILKGLIKYTTFIVALIGVLMLVVSGIQYSMSGADEGAAKNAKDRIKKVLIGIILLFLISFILNSVAPWIYQ